VFRASWWFCTLHGVTMTTNMEGTKLLSYRSACTVERYHFDTVWLNEIVVYTLRF
jgi:hypothetical protein